MKQSVHVRNFGPSAARRSVGLFLLGLGLLLGPGTAAATPFSFTVNLAQSKVFINTMGNAYGSANITTPVLAFDVDYTAVGSSKPFTLTGLVLPSVLADVGSDFFSFSGLPASIAGTIDIVTGAITSAAIGGTMTENPPGSPTGSVAFAGLVLSTATTAGGDCSGLFSAIAGSPVNSAGSATMWGASCVNAAASLNGKWLIRTTLVGTFSPNPINLIPEPGTGALLASGISFVAWASRRRNHG
jgi:hypothetical protein